MNTGRNKDLPEKVDSARSADALGYGELLEELKARIRSARVRASLAVNRELVHLYWHIGREILSRQHAERWERRWSIGSQPISVVSSRT